MTILISSNYYQFWKKHINLRPKTIRTYTTVLKNFEKYLIHNGFSGYLNFDKFYFYEQTQDYYGIDKEFITYLKDQRGASNDILFLSIVVLRNFFRFLFTVGLIKENPVSSFHNPYYKSKIYNNSLSINESERLLQIALKTDPFIRQNYLIVLLLLTTGLRNNELRSLTYEQIDFERNVIYVDKGQKTDASTVYMTNRLAEELARYMSHQYFQEWKEKKQSIIFRNKNAPFTERTLNKLLGTLSKKAGINKNVTAHCLRHTMANLMQKEGINIRVIQRQLRHKSVGTTLRYLSPVDSY